MTLFSAASCDAASAHRFDEYNFSSMQRCHLCDKFLYGLMRQGLQCRECGLCCHRFCSATHPTECNVPKLEHHRRPSFSQCEYLIIVCFYFTRQVHVLKEHIFMKVNCPTNKVLAVIFVICHYFVLLFYICDPFS